CGGGGGLGVGFFWGGVVGVWGGGFGGGGGLCLGCGCFVVFGFFGGGGCGGVAVVVLVCFWFGVVVVGCLVFVLVGGGVGS
ncbi:hypothetical protein DVA80_21195, partial [Acinetobacter baumannii]|uniref:hypothetical protein n=1 Tax=Acinetobacter baumannii TaxID=470 RepID=UPI000DFB8052